MNIKNIIYAGKSLLPLVEGGKGVGVSNGTTAGHWAKFGAIGTFSGVNPALPSGLPYVYNATNRIERQKELIIQSIEGCLHQAKIAKDICGNSGAVLMNVLWEMGGAKEVLDNVLSRAKGLIDGISCGAGLPYELAEICSRHNVLYNPIISSARALKILWRQSYQKYQEHFGAVIYEDPWFAGGHLGFTNKEDPARPESLFERVKEIRTFLNEVGMKTLPIIVAGGIWSLSEVTNLLDNEDIGNVAFQFGTRPIVTQETPLPIEIKQRFLALTEKDVLINDLSPTGFKSSAIVNNFLKTLLERRKRVFNVSTPNESSVANFSIAGQDFVVDADNLPSIQQYVEQGFSTYMYASGRDKIALLNPSEKETIMGSMKRCMGCLSHCAFSGFTQYDKVLVPNPTYFCIQETLQSVAHEGSFEENLIFSGRNGYRFKADPLYQNGTFIPTTEELLTAIMQGK